MITMSFFTLKIKTINRGIPFKGKYDSFRSHSSAFNVVFAVMNETLASINILTTCSVLQCFPEVKWTEALREKCSYPEFFWSAFLRIPTEYGDLLCKSLYSVQMRENVDQKNSEYGHFSRSVVSALNFKFLKRKLFIIVITQSLSGIAIIYSP